MGPPSEDLRRRLLAVTRLGAPVNLSAVVLGEFPGSPTIEVLPDGSAHISHGSHRLAILDRSTALDLLTVLHEAHAPLPEATDDPQEAQLAEPSDNHLVAGTQPEAPSCDGGGVAAALVQRRVTLRVFGRVAVLDADGNPIPGLRQHAGGLLLRRAAERLSTEVGNLRRCIRQASAGADLQPVVNTGGRYHLNPDAVDVDVWRFQDAVREASAATDDTRRAKALTLALEARRRNVCRRPRLSLGGTGPRATPASRRPCPPPSRRPHHRR